MFDQIRFVYNQQKEEDGNNKFDAKKIRELFLTDGNKSILSKKDLLVEFIDELCNFKLLSQRTTYIVVFLYNFFILIRSLEFS